MKLHTSFYWARPCIHKDFVHDGSKGFSYNTSLNIIYFTFILKYNHKGNRKLQRKWYTKKNSYCLHRTNCPPFNNNINSQHIHINYQTIKNWFMLSILNENGDKQSQNTHVEVNIFARQKLKARTRVWIAQNNPHIAAET